MPPALSLYPISTVLGILTFLPSYRYDQRCSTNIPLLFLKYKLVESASLNSAINICLRKKSYRNGQTVTVSDILNDESLDKMIAHDDAFKFVKTIRSSPAFWQQKQKELMFMIRQLGCPTFFLRLQQLRLNGQSCFES